MSILQNYYKLKEARFYKGDLSASAILVDVDSLIARSNLNEKQAYVVQYYWKEGYTQEEVATHLGVSQQMVDKYCKRVKSKIEGELKKWGEI